jgi:hypothetical protein
MIEGRKQMEYSWSSPCALRVDGWRERPWVPEGRGSSRFTKLLRLRMCSRAVHGIATKSELRRGNERGAGSGIRTTLRENGSIEHGPTPRGAQWSQNGHEFTRLGRRSRIKMLRLGCQASVIPASAPRLRPGASARCPQPHRTANHYPACSEIVGEQGCYPWWVSRPFRPPPLRCGLR